MRQRELLFVFSLVRLCLFVPIVSVLCPLMYFFVAIYIRLVLPTKEYKYNPPHIQMSSMAIVQNWA